MERHQWPRLRELYTKARTRKTASTSCLRPHPGAPISAAPSQSQAQGSGRQAVRCELRDLRIKAEAYFDAHRDELIEQFVEDLPAGNIGCMGVILSRDSEKNGSLDLIEWLNSKYKEKDFSLTAHGGEQLPSNCRSRPQNAGTG